MKRARRRRDSALVQGAEQAQTEAAAWAEVRHRHLTHLDRVRQAAEAVTRLAADDALTPLKVAWLLVSLESAHAWTVDDVPEPPSSVESSDDEFRDVDFRLSLEMISAREAVAQRLAYHLINEAAPTEPEWCAELECPEDCSGRHDSEHIDCGPDAVFEDLAEYGIEVELPDDVPPPRRSQSVPEEPLELGPETAERFADALAHFGLDHEDTELLLNAAAVGLVADAWRDGPLDELLTAGAAPTDGEIFAQSVDLYRTARAALLAARDDGPEELLVFRAIASDVRLPWAGGSGVTLAACSGPAEEFVRDVDNRVWFSSKLMREQGWRIALMHRALSAVVKAPAHFGMPGWPAVVATAVHRLDGLDRTDAPDALQDIDSVKAALLEAPDRLGAEALDWLCGRMVFAPESEASR